MKPNKFEKIIGTGLFTGYSPFASGTVGSLIALVFLPLGTKVLVALAVLLFLYGIYIGSKFEIEFGKDPGIFTLDEFVGTWVAFIAIPLNLYSIIFIFSLWRFFDIVKPFPVKNAEKLSGGLGIMADDVLAAIYANVIGRVIIFFITK